MEICERAQLCADHDPDPTTAGILGPLMATLGYTTPVGAALVVAAIGCGAMTVSHANDSSIRVVTSFPVSASIPSWMFARVSASS